MATPTKKNSSQDEKYNPSAQHEGHVVGKHAHPDSVDKSDPAESAKQDQYDAAFSDMTKGDNLKDLEEKSTKGDKASSVEAGESNPKKWDTNVKEGGGEKTSKGNFFSSRGNWAKIGLGGAGIFALIGIAFAGLLSMIINFKEINYESSMKRNWTRTAHRSKVNFKERWMTAPEDCKGVRCRIKQGVSDKEIKKLQNNGVRDIKVVEVERDINGQKKKVKYITNFTLQSGRQVTAGNFEQAFAEDKGVRRTISRSWQIEGKTPRTTYVAKMAAKLGLKKKNAFDGKKTKEEMKKSLRERLFGAQSKGIKVSGTKKGQDGKDAAVAGLNDISQEVQTLADEEKKRLLEDPKAKTEIVPDFNFGKTAQRLGRGFSVVGVLSTVCEAYGLLKAVDYGTKIYRALALMRYAAVFMSFADAMKAGKVTGEQVNFVAIMLLTPDEKGHNFFDSAAMQHFLYKKKPRKEAILPYATGTVTAKNIGELRNQLSVGGASDKACGFINNGAVQVAAAIISVGLAILSGGTSLAGTLAANAGVGLILTAVEAYAIPLLIKYAAGTLYDGDENGKEIGDIVGAGMLNMSGYYGRSQGLRPITQGEAAQEAQETNWAYEDLKGDQKPGLSSKVAISLTGFVGQLIKPHALFTPKSAITLATAKTSPSAFAVDQVQPSDQCDDPDMRDANLATTDWCTPIYSDTLANLNDNKFRPTTIIEKMINEGHVDENGEPKSEEYKRYLEVCMDGTAPLVNSDVDIEGFGGVNTAQECSRTDDQATMFRMFRMDANINESEQEVIELYNKNSTPEAGKANPGTMGWPIAPPEAGSISSCWNISDASYRKHHGLDISAPIGTSIVAPADGEVIFSGTASGYGNYVAIKHAGVNSGYGHNSANLVKVGDKVTKGQPIAKVGNQGKSTGPHLHFNVMPSGLTFTDEVEGKTLNPLKHVTKPPGVPDPKNCVGKAG